MTEPTDAELWQLYMQQPGQHKDPIDFARAALAKRGQPAQAAEPVAREPLTDEQIQDLLLCENPTDEEMRLIRIGWDAANGIKGGQHDAG